MIEKNVEESDQKIEPKPTSYLKNRREKNEDTEISKSVNALDGQVYRVGPVIINEPRSIETTI